MSSNPYRGRREVFQHQYFQALSRCLADAVPGEEAELCQAIEALVPAIFEANAAMIEDEPSEFHLRMTSLVLASYRVLLPRLSPPERILEILQYALKEPYRAEMKSGFRQWLDTAPNLLKGMAEGARAKATWGYGKTFTFEYEGDGEGDFFASNVTRCFYHSFFVANGAPELTPVFCEWDSIWAEEIDPTQHGLRFDRPTTLGYGGGMCRFQFRKVAKEPAGDEPA
jgi:hypothetical protein